MSKNETASCGRATVASKKHERVILKSKWIPIGSSHKLKFKLRLRRGKPGNMQCLWSPAQPGAANADAGFLDDYRYAQAEFLQQVQQKLEGGAL